MTRTTESDVTGTYGTTALTSDQINQAIEDANDMVNRRWQEQIEAEVDASASNPSRADVLEHVERLLTCHLMKDAEFEIQSDSAEGMSVSFNIPTGSLEKWLENTSHGRTLKSKLAGLGITVSSSGRSLPGVYD